MFTGYDWDYTGVTFTTVSWVNYQIPSTEFASNPMRFRANDHSNLAVTFLGITIPANTAGPQALSIALDRLFNHPNAGPFFARQMIQRLVTSNPSPAYVGRVAAAFADNGAGVRGDLKAVWTAILMDDERGSSAARRQREKQHRHRDHRRMTHTPSCREVGRKREKPLLWPIASLAAQPTYPCDHR